MISTLIVEDEPRTAEWIRKLAEESLPELQVIGMLQTVKETIEWLKKNEQPDLFLMDIQLSDGVCFDIFEEFTIRKPVIFITAYDEYALKAFRANGIDYLLKPVVKKDIEVSLEKFRRYFNHPAVPDFKSVFSDILALKNYRSYFLIEGHDRLFTIATKDVAYFGYKNKSSYLITETNEFHFIAIAMEDLEKELNPVDFFRINRQYVVSRSCIDSINLYFNSRLKLSLKPAIKEDVIVSRERVNDFKQWLGY